MRRIEREIEVFGMTNLAVRRGFRKPFGLVALPAIGDTVTIDEREDAVVEIRSLLEGLRLPVALLAFREFAVMRVLMAALAGLHLAEKAALPFKERGRPRLFVTTHTGQIAVRIGEQKRFGV